MNPTSPGTRSPGYILPPHTSPSAQGHELEYTSLSDQEQWSVEGTCHVPVYSRQDNAQFKQTCYQKVEKISLQLQTMMTCLLEIFPNTIHTHWEAFSQLVSCLGNDLPAQIPLSVFTSSVAAACIANMEHAPSAKKRKFSDSSEEFKLQNQTLAAAQELATTISELFVLLNTGTQLNILKEKNPGSHQAHRAFQHTVSKRFAVECSIALNDLDRELAECIVSAIDPQGDVRSCEAKTFLLNNVTSEFLNAQKALIHEAFTSLASKKKSLPLTGKSLFASCKQHCTSSISVSANIEGFPSWQDLSFCYLARVFLQKHNELVPLEADCKLLCSKLKIYFPFSETASSVTVQQYLMDALAQDFVQVHSGASAKKNPPIFDISICYNEFLRCSTLITNLLKGLFILETSMCFSPQNFFAFQNYTQALHLPNVTAKINNAIQETASICSEEHQHIFSRTKLLLEEANTLLRQLIFQSLAITVVRKQKHKGIPSKDIVRCEWISDELRLSIPFCNYWKEAILAHNSCGLFSGNIPKTNKELTVLLNTTSDRLKIIFLQIYHNVLIDVLEDMPLECPENSLEQFFATARAFQAKLIPKYAPESYLFTIAMNSMAKSKILETHNSLLKLAGQNVLKTQKDLLQFIYSFLLHRNKHLPQTEAVLLAYCREQYTGTMPIPAYLEELPFWKDRIFLCLAQAFLRKKQAPSFLIDNVKSGISAVKDYFPIRTQEGAKGSNLRNLLTQDLAEALFSMKAEFSTTEHTTSAVMVYEDTAYESFLQSVASFNKLIQSFFKLETGKNLSQNTIRAFQRYTNNLRLHIVHAETQKIILGSVAAHIAEMQVLDAAQTQIKDNLSKISQRLNQLLKEALTILVFRKINYTFFTPQEAVTKALRITLSNAFVPKILLNLQESWTFWEHAIQHPPEASQWLTVPNYSEYISELCIETASELTTYFLKLCQALFVEISNEFFLESVSEQPLQIPEKKFIETSFLVYPKIISEPYYSQSIFKAITDFLAKDEVYTNCTQILTLATENFLQSQMVFAEHAYSHLIQHKLSLPLTGKELLAFYKNQYKSDTFIPLYLATLPSWSNLTFYALARIFLLKAQQKIAPNFHPWDLQILFNDIKSFFPEKAKELEAFPLETQLEQFTKHLAQHFNSTESQNLHDAEPKTTEIGSYAYRAYEHFLQSACLLRKFVRTIFKLKTGNDCSSQHLSELEKYITQLLVNEPDLRRKSALHDVFTICSAEIKTLKRTNIPQLWEDLNQANFLLQALMEASLALMLLCVTTDTELTPQQTIDIALQTTSSITSLPLSLDSLLTAFIMSEAGAHALQIAMNSYVSGTLCLQFFEQDPLFSQEKAINPLQETIDADLSGHSSPKCNEFTHALSSVFLSKKTAMETVCQKLYTGLREDVTAAMSKEPSLETPSQKFITTANNCHEKMMTEQTQALPLFRSLVLILAQEYEEELQKRSAAVSDQIMKTKEGILVTEEKTQEDQSNSVWKHIIDALMKEEDQATREQEHQKTTTQTTETGETAEPLQKDEELLLSEDFTDLLEQAGDLADFLGQSEDFTDFIEEGFQFEAEKTEEEGAS